MTKAQSTIEFLILFTVTIAFVSLLAAAILVQREKIQAKIDDVETINRAEAAVRALEAWLNAGIAMRFDFSEENISYRIEQNRFRVVHEGNVIEAGGVFATNASEPV